MPGCVVLFFKYKVHSEHQKTESNQVVGSQAFVPECDQSKSGENEQGDHFLEHLEFNEAEGPPVAVVAQLVGRYLKTVFKKGDAPTDGNDGKQTEFAKSLPVCKFEVAVPGKRHKQI